MQAIAFRDRTNAGRRLARLLADHAGSDAVVIGLPRGGVPVATEIAAALRAPLDVLVVRKLRAPGRPELGIGAVVDGRQPDAIVDGELIRELAVTTSYLRQEIAAQLEQVRGREHRLRGELPPAPVKGRTVILVDDGLATGSTMVAAVRGLRRLHPFRIVAALPVASREGFARVRAEADDVVVAELPPVFRAVGEHYGDFRQVSDDEVARLLAKARKRAHSPGRKEASAPGP